MKGENRMRKISIILYAFILILSFTGCGVKEKVENKIEEKISEKVIESVGGGNVDIDGDEITIKGEDGEELTIGGTEWPKSDLVKNIPEFKEGNVVSVMDTKDAIVISLDQVNKENFVKYLDEIKKDYAEEPFEMNADESITYSASNTNGIGVQLFYGNESLNITVAQSTE